MTVTLASRWRFSYLTKIAMLVVLILFGWSGSLILASNFPLTLTDVWQLLLGQAGNEIHQHIIYSIRMPRAFVAMLAGMGLAVAGLLMQSLTRNPLASPSIFGVSAGAAFAFAFASTGLLPWLSGVPILIVTMAGALLAGIMVFFLAGLHQSRVNPVRVVLSGVALNFLFISLTRAAVIFADEHAYGVMYWLTGSVANVGWSDVTLLLPTLIIGFLLSMYLSFQLNLLRLGESMMQSVGGKLWQVRTLSSLAIVVLIASCVSVAGPIGFVGLMVPHVARSWVGHDIRYLMPITLLIGGNLVLYADIGSRYINLGQENPVGIVTSLLGALFFLLLTKQQVRSQV
ncbi:FecCD family ABC transporter permease [Aliivibrio kagoshimensis]|uniref:FecCD family ABC transporter permease n=1 Tax=Aliivibrio kagoshimensis TaxID=2910230 RepID=UPI003D116111